ncbi:hypothetical protein MMC17_000632 [Xylographa soralifera]|nr:hypothetical protein [Xylographa soralifera]
MNRSSWSPSKEGRIQIGERRRTDASKRNIPVPKAILEDGVLHLLATAAEMQQRQDLGSANQLYEAAIAKMKAHSLDQKKFLTGTSKKPPPLNSRTPVEWCIHVGDMTSAITLLGDPNTAIAQMRTKVSLGCVKEILEAGANIEYRIGPIGRTLLLQEVYEGRHEGVRLALDYGASVSCMDDAGDTALALALRSVHPQSLLIITDLLEAGADVNLRDSHGQPLFYVAMEYALPEAIKHVIDGISPLTTEHHQLMREYVAGLPTRGNQVDFRTCNVLSLLLQHGLDPNSSLHSDGPRSLLDWAMRGQGNDSDRLVEDLMERDAKPDLEIALQYAEPHKIDLVLTKLVPLTEAQHRQLVVWVQNWSDRSERWTEHDGDVLKLLLDFGLNPNLRQESAPHSPLIVCAVNYGNLSVVEKLVALKANLTVSDDNGDTAIIRAAKTKNRPIYDAIQAGGVNDRYILGWTVWTYHN